MSRIENAYELAPLRADKLAKLQAQLDETARAMPPVTLESWLEDVAAIKADPELLAYFEQIEAARADGLKIVMHVGRSQVATRVDKIANVDPWHAETGYTEGEQS